MTNEELDRAAAVDVMGWHEDINAGWWVAESGVFTVFTRDFSPVTNWQHAGMLVDRMRELGFHYRTLSCNEHDNLAHFFRGDADWQSDCAFHATPKLAITTAAVDAIRRLKK